MKQTDDRLPSVKWAGRIINIVLLLLSALLLWLLGGGKAGDIITYRCGNHFTYIKLKTWDEVKAHLAEVKHG